MPSWLAPLLKFILEEWWYRSFAWLTEGAVPTLDGDKRAAGSFSLLCGYNIRECPECVGDGISFSGCSISEQQREMA